MSECCENRDITLVSATDGASVASATVDSSNQITFTLSNGTQVITNALTITDAGAIILSNDNTAETTDIYTSGVPVQIGNKTYTIPANTLSTDGSQARITAWLTKTISTTNPRDYVRIYVNGAWFINVSTYPGVQNLYTGDSEHKIKIEMTLTRVSNTSINVDFNGSVYGYLGMVPDFGKSGHQALDPAALGAFNFTTTGITVAVFAQSFNSTDVNMTCDRFTIEKILK